MSIPRLLLTTAWITTVSAAFWIGQNSATPTPAVQSARTAGVEGRPIPAEPARHTRGEDADSSSQPGSPTEGVRVSRNVPLLIDHVQSALAIKGTSLPALLRTLAPLSELDHAEVKQALERLDASGPDDQKGLVVSILLSQWAETDPLEALAYAEKEDKKSSSGDPSEGAKIAVIGTWAQHDPGAAWRWFQNQDAENTPLRREMQSTIFASFADHDLDGAFARLNSLEENDRAAALTGILNATTRDIGMRDQLLEHSASLAPELRRQLQQCVVGHWAAKDPDAAMQWVRSQPTEEQARLRKMAGGTLLLTAPERGAAILLEGSSEKDRANITTDIVSSWAPRDPQRAGEWLNKQPQGPEIDNARRTFATAISQRDPAAAMDWAKTITSEKQRSDSTQQVYQAWKRKDPAAADAALNASGLSAERIQQIRKAGQAK